MDRNMRYTPKRTGRPARSAGWDNLRTDSADSARARLLTRRYREDTAEITAEQINDGENTDLQEILAGEIKKGLRDLCKDPQTLTRFATILNIVLPVFADELDGLNLAGFYLWDGTEATGLYEDCDGMSVWQVRADNPDITRYAVGLADHAFEYGTDYALFVLIHELAHILAPEEDGEHTPRYHRTLDSMLAFFAAETGIKLQNDYIE